MNNGTDEMIKRKREVFMTRKQAGSRLFWCLFGLYTINILGKTSFSAATAVLVDEMVLTKTQAGLVGGAFWLLYAVGQFAGGFITNRVSSYRLIQITVVTSAAANLILAFLDDFLPMLIVWGLSGLLQFGLWPAVLKIVSTELDPGEQTKAMNRLALCYCLGSALSYVLTSVILRVGTWQAIFIAAGILTAASMVAVLYAEHRLSPMLARAKGPEKETAKPRQEKLTWDIVWASGLIFFCVLTVIKGIADTGIKNWMPTIMVETYHATPSFTAALSVILLVTNVFGVVFCMKLYDLFHNDELKTLRVLFLMALPMMLLLLKLEDMNIFVCTLLMCLITILMYGSGQILIMHYPGRFLIYGQTAAVGGIVNSFAAAGNVIATYGSGYVADNYGWTEMIILWNVLVVVFLILTVAMIPLWKKFRRADLRK